MTWTNVVKPGTIASIDKNDYVGSVSLQSGNAIAWAQSFHNTEVDTLKVCKFYLAKTNSSLTGNAFATLYAHTGTFGTSSKPTGSPLATSDNFDVSSLALGVSASDFRLVGFNFSGYEMSANTDYCIALNYSGGGGAAFLMAGAANVIASEGNISATLNLSAWTPSAGTGLIFSVNVEVDYTNVARPKGAYTITAGMATGLLMSPTYATSHAGGASYTNISKPSSGSWTNITKPT